MAIARAERRGPARVEPRRARPHTRVPARAPRAGRAAPFAFPALALVPYALGASKGEAGGTLTFLALRDMTEAYAIAGRPSHHSLREFLDPTVRRRVVAGGALVHVGPEDSTLRDDDLVRPLDLVPIPAAET